jgi:hypothetical protein
MQAAYFEWADPDAARDHLRRHVDYYRKQVELLTDVRNGILERSDPAIRRRLERYPEAEHERIVAYKAFTYEGMIERSRAEMAWAERGLGLIDRLSPPDAS